MRAWLLAAMYCIVLPDAFADALAAREVLQACSDNAAEDAVGLDQLESACPGMHAALGELGFAGQLCDSCRDAIDADALTDLIALHDRYIATATTAAPNPDTVDAVLVQVRAGQAGHQVSWWDRVKAWLRQWMGGESGKVPPWFERLIEHLTVSEWVMQIILYTLIAVVIGMAVAVVIAELRAAGLFAKQGVVGSRIVDRHSDTGSQGALTLADVKAAAAVDRPSMMLRLLVSILIANRQLMMERNLTHRELTRRAQFAAAPERTQFEQLALLAELVRYGRFSADENTVTYAQRVLDGAYDLYEQLQRSAPAPALQLESRA